MKSERTQTTYNQIVNFDKDSREITVLDYIFFDTMHGKPFNGATGSKFEPVSRAEYEERTSRENIIEYLMDATNEVPEQFKRGGFEAWADAIIDANEQDQVCFDTSYSELWEYLREELNLTEDEAFIFNCIGGGRCFDKTFKGNINPELSKLIRKAEK